MKYVCLFVATSVLINVITMLVYISASPYGIVRGLIAEEDKLIENLTAVLFFCTFLFALLLVNTRGIVDRFNRKWLILLLALGLIGFLDELSFGERLFDLEMPVIGGVEIDAVHDFTEFGLRLTLILITDYQLAFSLVLLGGLVLSIVAILKYGNRFWTAVIADRHYPLYLVMFFFMVLIFSALSLDTGQYPFRGYQVVEECLELNAALALLTSCIIIYKLATNRQPTQN